MKLTPEQALERMLEAAALLQHALIDIDHVANATRQSYADYQDNPHRGRLETRPMTMKDAKRLAGRASRTLRQVWDILDPPGDRHEAHN